MQFEAGNMEARQLKQLWRAILASDAQQVARLLGKSELLSHDDDDAPGARPSARTPGSAHATAR